MQPADTHDTYDAIGRREDLADIIYNIAPLETPAQAAFGRGRSSQILHEWQRDTLAAAANNAQIDGDDYVGDAQVATERLGNYTQISAKVIIVSGTVEAVDKAGRKSELAYLLSKNGKELKRDVEFVITQNRDSVVGNATTARVLGPMESWMETNTNRGSGGSDGGHQTGTPGDVNLATDGTLRNLTESMVKGVIQSAWTEGGNPTMIMVGPSNKVNISAFTGNATRFDRSEDKKLVTSIDVYVSDFGDHRVVPNRFQRERTLFVLDPALWSVDYLRSYRQIELAKTGDNEKRLLLTEYTLRCSEEKGSAAVADLN